jgi:glycosyltransferase involved in cell wall biosynthesis
VIVVLAHTHPSLSSGGAEISAYTLYTGLRALGEPCAFVALCPDSQAHRAVLETEGEHLVGYTHDGYDDFYHIGDPLVVDELLALLDRLGCTTAVFHHFLFFGLNAVRGSAAVPGRRTLLVLHEFLAICHHHGQMVTRPALRLCDAASPAACARCFPELDARQFAVRRETLLDAFAGVAHFVSPSRFLAQRFGQWGLDEARIAVIENGVPKLPAPEERRPSAGERSAAPERAGVSPSGAGSEASRVVRIGYFGQINPFKGIDLLLEALELLRRDRSLAERVRVRVHGPLVGVTPEFQARFEQEVARRDILEYVGPYQNSRVFDLMRDGDYVLMASKWWENSPVVIQEAFACGRPLIVPGIGGMAEKVVDGRSGLHFRPGDAADLVRAIALACEDGAPARLRAGLPAVVDAGGMARAYLDLIEGLPADGAAPGPSPSVIRLHSRKISRMELS